MLSRRVDIFYIYRREGYVIVPLAFDPRNGRNLSGERERDVIRIRTKELTATRRVETRNRSHDAKQLHGLNVKRFARP